ncbi:hypothetical protein [Amycolatopsis jejuensis]|uniref:hypothetical protein n=1 Tax=Amycolatopsis jejuensis TaxID=330084 RepID=UPI0005246F98|nr:hypothetical protein [Amycolatopsis jejuensis]
MADFVFNIAKGKIAYYAGLPATNDALIAVLLQSTNLEADSTLKDYDNVSLLLAGTSDEVTATNYARKTLTGVSSTVDDTNDRVDITSAAFTFTALGGASNQAVGKLVICYDPDTAGGTDADLVPLVAFDQSFTTSGVDETFTPQSPGFLRAA